MSGVRKRKIEADYINTSPGTSTPEYSLCGTGFSKLSESPSAQTSKKRYINQESSSQHVTGYEWSCSFETDQIPDEKAVNFILEIGKNLKSGPEAETDFVQVDLDAPVEGKENTYKARKRKIAIAVKELPDNDGELGANGDFLGVTDPVTGEFDVNTKTFTADAESASGGTSGDGSGTTSEG